MQTMSVITGFGYIKDINGHIVCKYVLPKGDHPLKDGYTFVEVEKEADLEAVEIYESPEDKQKREEEALIGERIRKLAVDSLKADGLL